MADNLTLGRGEVHFAQFKPGTQVPKGERYFGNTPELNLTINAQTLDHFSSDRGIREKDNSVTLETTRTGSTITDNINPDNVALFFFGSVEDLAIASVTVTDELLNDVELGLTYQLGTSGAHPSGHRGLDEVASGVNVIVSVGDDTIVAGSNVTVDMELGRLTVLADATDIVDGDDLKIDYKVKAQTRTRIISGTQAIEGSMRYISKNPVGKLIDYFMPWVKITPNGDYALKGEEWQQLPFTLEVLKKPGLEAIYADGRPLTV